MVKPFSYLVLTVQEHSAKYTYVVGTDMHIHIFFCFNYQYNLDNN
jgi:hypothetical protein